MNYWRILANADTALAAGDFVAAESLFAEARQLRDASPLRIFWSERLVDGLRRVWHDVADRGASAPPADRWPTALNSFHARFRERAEAVVREAVRSADLRPEDAAEANQPVIEAALHLVTRSALFGEEPTSAIILLKGLMRTVQRTGRLSDVELIRHDLPLTDEDRLWVARRGFLLLTELAAEKPTVVAGDAASDVRRWAEALVRLLDASYFAPVGRLQEERAWCEVSFTDRLLGDAPRAVALYRAYLALNPEPGQRSDEARVRILELLANVSGQHFPIPRYSDAQQSVRSATLTVGSRLTERLDAALALMELRRPTAEPSQAWAAAAATADHLVFVTWWHDQPRDVAFWTPGTPTDILATFLAPCAGRIVWADAAAAKLLPPDEAWSGGWPVDPFVVALLEESLPASGLDTGARQLLALAEAGAWRAGWNRLHGHPLLEPPRRADRLEATGGDGVYAAVTAGLLWRACLTRVATSDPALRAGCGEMARRGDPAARFLYSCLVLGDPEARAADASFQPWLLPLLWARPGPLATVAANAADAPRLNRPDLSGSRVAVVSSGNPAAAVSAWAGRQRRVRVVVDGANRLDAVVPLAGSAYGPVTLVPPDGRLHDLEAALALLEELLVGVEASADEDRWLPLFHWVRLVESHNGDLLDFLALRPRRDRSVRLYARYCALVARLPRVAPQADGGGVAEPWSVQYSQRARRSGLVVGHVDALTPADEILDAVWGVYAGSDASWVFLDSAAVHWRLMARGVEPLERLHARLARRGGRHLSVLTAAVFDRNELEDLLAQWLVEYGDPYRLILDDVTAPRLLLAAAGVAPDARLLSVASGAGQLARLAAVAAAGRECGVRLPAAGRWHGFWTDTLAGAFGPWPDHVRPAPDAGPDAAQAAYLLVPQLTAFAMEPAPGANEAAPEAAAADSEERVGWSRADRARRRQAVRLRAICALEINALLAGGARTVDIADPRWWRIMRPERDDPSSGTIWTAARALAAAVAGRAEAYDLSVTTGPKRRAGRAPTTEAAHWHAAVAGWLQRHAAANQPVGTGAPEGEAWGDERPVPSPDQTTVSAGGRIVFCRGQAEGHWQRIAASAVAAWERGELDHYALAVAAEPPPGAAAWLAHVCVPGATVWPAGGAAGSLGAPGPILWLQAEDFLRPEVVHALQLYPPRAIWVGDLAAWLPTAERPQTAVATALRWIATAAAPTCVIAVGDVPQPWVDYLHNLAASAASSGGGAHDRELELEKAAAAGFTAGEPPRVAVGCDDSWRVDCPRCGAAVAPQGATVACPQCALAVLSWLGPAEQRTLARALDGVNVAALIRREESVPALSLRLWAEADRVTELARRVAQGRCGGPVDVQRSGGSWSLALGTARHWRLSSRDRLAAFDPDCHHALLFAPPPWLQGLPAWPPDARGTLSAWFHPAQLAGDERDSAPVRTRRLWRLLRELPRVCPMRPDPDEPDSTLVPLSYLTYLSGVESHELIQGVNTARWLALLAGDAVSAVAEYPPPGIKPRLAAGRLFAEIEADAHRLQRLLPEVIGQPLATLVAGETLRIDLGAYGRDHDRRDVRALDHLLSCWSLQLPCGDLVEEDGEATHGPKRGSVPQIWYRPESGALFSERRLIGYLGDPAATIETLQARLDQMLAVIGRLWAAAERDAAGVRLALTPSIQVPRWLPALGTRLGWWRWEGRGGADALPLIDLLTLADSAALHADTVSGELWCQLLEWHDRWQTQLRSAWQDGELVTAAPVAPTRAEPAPSRRRFSLTRTERLLAYELAAARVGEFAAPGGDGSKLLVLRGMSGSGRLAAVTGGVERALRQGTAPVEFTYYCPDTATAARVHLALRRRRRDLAPDIEIAGERPWVATSAPDGESSRDDTIAVVLEVQRFPAAERYRIFERARAGRLVMTVDMAEAVDSWEDMFLTTPGHDEVIVLEEQIRQARRLWTEVRQLLPPASTARERAARRDKGQVNAFWAANLDECIACLLAEHAAGRLQAPVALTAPLDEDCTYLGRALASRGWLPVFRRELDELLLPGPFEFVAAVSDVVASAGQMSVAAAGGATRTVVTNRGITGEQEALLTPLLPTELRGDYQHWLASMSGRSAVATPARLYESLAGTAWAAPLFAPPAARARVAALLAKLGEEDVGTFCQRPLREAWWYEAVALTDRAAPVERRPVVTLAAAEDRTGRFAADGVYLCLGGEPDGMHYRVLSRISDRCLVLYQEHSPLPSSADGDQGRPDTGAWR